MDVPSAWAVTRGPWDSGVTSGVTSSMRAALQHLSRVGRGGPHPAADVSGCPAVWVPCVLPASPGMGLRVSEGMSLSVPHGVCLRVSCLGIVLSLFEPAEAVSLHTFLC